MKIKENPYFQKLSIFTFFMYIIYVLFGSHIYRLFKPSEELDIAKIKELRKGLIIKYNISDQDILIVDSLITKTNRTIPKKVKNIDPRTPEQREATVCLCKIISAIIAIMLQSLLVYTLYNAAWLSFIVAGIQRVIIWKDNILNGLKYDHDKSLMMRIHLSNESHE